jgi:hypothetical protein
MPTVLHIDVEGFELRYADVCALEIHEPQFQRDYLLKLPTGETFKRRIDFEDEKDYADMKVAANFWDHAERVEAVSREAALVDRCLAVERIFPESRELLPA